MSCVIPSAQTFTSGCEASQQKMALRIILKAGVLDVLHDGSKTREGGIGLLPA